VSVIGGVMALGIFVIGNPLLDRIASAKERLKKAESQAALAEEVGSLRRQASLYQKKVPTKIDLNDWTEYLLGGIRGQRVKLLRMDPKDQASIGPCKIVTWQIEME